MLRISREILLHVFMDFFLKVDSHCAVRTNDLIGAYAGVFGNIAAGIRNANVGGVVTHGVLRSFFCGGDQLSEELLARTKARWSRLR